jgi:hypothetical protein
MHVSHNRFCSSSVVFCSVLSCLLPHSNRSASQLQSVSEGLSKAVEDCTAALQQAVRKLGLPGAQPTADSSSSSSSSSSGGGGSGSTAVPFDLSVLGDVTERCQLYQQVLRTGITDLAKYCDYVTERRNSLAQLQAMSNPYTSALQQLQRQQETQAKQLEQQQQLEQELQQKVGWQACHHGWPTMHPVHALYQPCYRRISLLHA